MRVLVLTRGDLFPANHGAAVKIVRTAESLVARGDEVWVVTDDRDHYWEVGREGWAKRPYGPRARAAEEWPVLRNGARIERWIRRLGYPAEELFLYRPLLDPAWWLRAAWVGRRHAVDVYQAEFPGYAAPALVAARLSGGRTTLVEHNVEFDRLRQMSGLSPAALRRVRAIEALLARRVDDVVAVSEEDRRRLGEVGVARVHVVPHGVDLRAYDTRAVNLRARYGLGPGPVLFFHGTLHYGPNADAVRYLDEVLGPRLPAAATLLIAGLTPPLHRARPGLRFTGPVEDLPGHVLGADLCLCPLTAGGGTRMKLLEYFAAGKPVVSTPLGAEGLPVADGTHLVLAEPDTFADAVLALLDDPARRRALGRAARAWVGARDWSAVAEAYQAVHAGRGRDFVARPSVEAHLPPRRPSKPLTLLFLVNRGCNLRCRFCDLWEGKEHVPVPQALALFDEAVAIGTRTVVLTGGEPLLHPGLFDLVRGAKARGLSVNVTTNGTLVERHWDAIVSSGIESLSFSVDGLPATHDRLRGRPGAHDLTWQALERAVRQGGLDPCVYFVVTRENVGELVEVWRRVRALGARFDFWPVNDAPGLYLTTDAEKRAWREAVETIAGAEAEVAARAPYYREALEYHAGRSGPVRCLGLVDQYGVTYRGELLPCCVWGADGLAVGNVFERPLTELWWSPEVQAARERLHGAGCVAGCYNHSLYEYGVSTGLSHRVQAGSARPLGVRRGPAGEA